MVGPDVCRGRIGPLVDEPTPAEGDDAPAKGTGPADGHHVLPDRPRPSRLKLSFVVVPLVGLVIAGYVGDALAPSLIPDRAIWLISLNARNRNLVLVTNYLEWWQYYPVGFVRLLVSDPLFYLLGWWYGDAAVRWMERRTNTFGSILRTAQRWFGKAAAPLVVIAPNNFICLFAGSAGMRPATFLALNAVGTIGRLVLIRWLGDVFTSPIGWAVDFIQEYRLPLTVLSVAFVGFTIWQETRTGETELEALLNIEDELEEVEEELEEEWEQQHDDPAATPSAEGEAGDAGGDAPQPAGGGPEEPS